ncbi:MAG: sulfurtransferase [Bacteroidetes bacterium]|nr:MAG: sulfurtransferase [Bacteroidota bacterium]
MNWLLPLIFIISLAIPAEGKERTIPVFVSTQWLAEHLNNPDIVILHIAFSRSNYTVGHIPGAQYLWFSWLAPSNPELSTELPTLEQADSVMEKFGITNQSRIILYFTGGSITTTTRMFLTFNYFGLGEQTSVLDGGFDAWKAEKRLISTEAPVVKRSSLTLSTKPSVVTDADWVKENLANPNVIIIDSRDSSFYNGNGGGVVRTGHIKGAKCMPFSTLVDSLTKVKDTETLQRMFDKLGVKKGTKIVSYCHVGQQATVTFAVATMLGYDATVYDGCFEDWNVRDESYPVEKPEAEKKE